MDVGDHERHDVILQALHRAHDNSTPWTGGTAWTRGKTDQPTDVFGFIDN